MAEGAKIILSVDCFIRENAIAIEPLFVKVILACFLPLGIILIACLIWAVLGLCFKSWQIRRNIVISIIVLIFVQLPTISSITMAVYNCSDIFKDGNTYLANDMSITCWEGEQKKYAMNFGIPIILVWIIGFPILALIIMFRNRKRLSDE